MIDPLATAMRRIMLPLVRLALSRGLVFQTLSDWLKDAYVLTATRHFSLDEKRITDSRLSLLTGLQRKDIKAIRSRLKADSQAPISAGHLPRLLAHWRNDARFQTGEGQPAELSRAGEGASFEVLVTSVTQDLHPRTALDELLRLGAVEVEADRVCLTTDAFLPTADDAAMLGYLGGNLGDHAAAAVENVLHAPAPGPNFERAVHYNRLSEDSARELDGLSRKLGQAALEKINAR
ncbi:MAG: DUF6502 family protein, partial [Pseudomonadota bacterium]